MNKHIIPLFLALVAFVSFANGQKIIGQSYYDSLYATAGSVLKVADMVQLNQLSPLKMTTAERNVPLPSAVNNALSRFMIPIFYQAALECGQASTLCYTLTYELLRRRNQDYMWGYDFQYPSHFAWNFCNQGYSRGVTSMESWQVIRTAGTPTVNEWGGWYSYGGPKRWLSGYNLYHSAMKNRISEIYAIHIDNEEGILTLKHWLNDHLNGETTGGLANFYSTYIGTITNVLPDGTPEAGKKILTAFTSNVNHSQTIVGYNDSIRWDYNGDGQYTNNIDINNDGVVNVKDWEIGGVIFCNTFGTAFADQGYCYLPYCKLACLPAEGGIWNNTVYVPFVKDEVYPQITYKATIRHTSRNKIKLTAGISTNPNATAPDHTMEFSVFNYQGGDQYMQGDTVSESNKTLELGLDVSPLLNYAIPDSACKFFFNVIENDPNNEDNGTIVHFGLMDYTSGSEVEQAYLTDNVNITNNSTTTLSVVRAIHFTKPVIQDSIIPNMNAFVEYSHQLTASGGKSPYRWEFTRDYTIGEFSANFPSDVGTAVTLSNANNGYAVIPLNFDFPFYGDTYNQVVIYADGYLTFHRDTYNWPFMQLEDVQTMTTRMIAPFKTDLSNCAVRKVSGTNYLLLIINAIQAGESGTSVNYAVKLYEDGTIEYYYGNMYFNGTSFWSAILRGDAQTIQHTAVSGAPAAQMANRCFRLTPQPIPTDLTLSPTGLLSGTSSNAYANQPFSITCYDDNDVKTTKMLHVSSIYPSLLLISNLTADDKGRTSIYSGDTVYFNIAIKNMDTLAYQNCNLKVTSEDPYITMIDSTEYFGYIGPENEYILNHCVSFAVNANTPNLHVANFNITVDNNISPVHTTRSFAIHSCDIDLESFELRDAGNHNMLVDPSEIDTLLFTFKNAGEQSAKNVSFSVHANELGISILQGTAHTDSIMGEDVFSFPSIFAALPTFSQGRTFDVFIDIFTNGQLIKTVTASIIGINNCTDFEGGIMPSYMVGEGNQVPWTIDSSTFYTSDFSLHSGTISHNDTSTVQYDITLTQAGNLSFAYKTSSENTYDWLYFFVDGTQKDRWSGLHDWTEFSTALSAGTHHLAWKYIKDYSVNGNDDRVWIDHICLPVYNDHSPNLSVTPEMLEVTLHNHDSRTLDTTLTYENPSDIYVLYDNNICDAEGEPVGWASIGSENGSINALEQKEIPLHFSSIGYPVGDYTATLSITLSNDSVIGIPITLHITDDSGIEDYSMTTSLKVFPNPARETVNIDLPGAFIQKIQLYDIFGKLILQQSVNENHTNIDLQHLSKGVYVVRLQTDSGVLTRKLVKQ